MSIENGIMDNDSISKNDKCRFEEFFEDMLLTLSEGAYEPSERGAGFTFSKTAQENAFSDFLTFIDKEVKSC